MIELQARQQKKGGRGQYTQELPGADVDGKVGFLSCFRGQVAPLQCDQLFIPAPRLDV